jgi:putative alpha-1,2-mannosidase
VDFDAAVAAAQAAWAAELARVAVADAGSAYTDAEAQAYRTVFYSSVYRASKYPRDLSEVDAVSGETVHWSPYTGQVRSFSLGSPARVSLSLSPLYLSPRFSN